MRASLLRLFIVCVAIWGTTWVAITYQLGSVPPEASIAWRFGLAAAIMAAICRARGLRLRFDARTHLLLALLGLFMFCLSYVAVYHAETLLVSGLVAVGYSVSPLSNTLASRLAFHTPVSGRMVFAGVVGTAGVVLIFWPEVARFEAGGGGALGVGLTAGAVAASSVGNVFATLVERRGLDVWQKMTWGMAYGALGCLVAGLLRGQAPSFAWTVPYVASLLYLAVFGSILAFAAYLTLLARAGAARAGYVGTAVPVVALMVSGVVEGFAWGASTFVGVAVVVAGNILALGGGSSVRGRPSEPDPPARSDVAV
jgi:drug/metabolite transporter (DMT)-like permease